MYVHDYEVYLRKYNCCRQFQTPLKIAAKLATRFQFRQTLNSHHAPFVSITTKKLTGRVTVVQAYPDVFHTGLYGQIKPNGGRHARLAVTGCTDFGFQDKVQTMLVGCGGIQAVLRPGYFL